MEIANGTSILAMWMEVNRAGKGSIDPAIGTGGAH